VVLYIAVCTVFGVCGWCFLALLLSTVMLVVQKRADNIPQCVVNPLVYCLEVKNSSIVLNMSNSCVL